MRAVRAIVCACALAACATGKAPGSGDDTANNPDGPAAPVCGDHSCAATEVGTCTVDCGMPPPMSMCGDTKCEPPAENSSNCVQDCPVSSNCNHNQVCDANESTADCADDCPPPAMEVCPLLPSPPFPPNVPAPSSCKDCATGDQIACIVLGKTMAECAMCVVQYCIGQTANASCDFPETPITCVDCFQ